MNEQTKRTAWTLRVRPARNGCQRLGWQIWLVLLLVACGCAVHTVQKQSSVRSEPEPELEIRFRNADESNISTKPVGGWPLTLTLEANKKKLMGIGRLRHAKPPIVLAGQGAAAYSLLLAFDDPDGCPSWADLASQERHRNALRSGTTSEDWASGCTQLPPVPWPVDEGLEFTPGQNVPIGIGEQLEMRTFDPQKGTNSDRTPVGPYAGSSTDFYGYGGNSRLPGLVLLADTGPGVVFDEDFNRSPRLAARNLAGFFDTVSYELKNPRGRVEVEAHMLVPPGLFTPVVLLDNALRKPCDGKVFQARVDGGPPMCGLPTPNSIADWIANDALFAAGIFLHQHTVTLRAFVTRGAAPEVLEDLNGDGVVDIADARQQGLKPLSGQAILRIQHYRIEPFLREWSPVLYDLDGNGDAGALHEPSVEGSPAALVDPPP